MDGATYARVPRSGFSRPFMFMGSPEHVPGGRDGSWERDWKLLTGWKRWIVLSGAEHQSFAEGSLLCGRPRRQASPRRPVRGALGRTHPRVRRGLLDQHLKSRRQPLLDRPSPRYPEVRFCPATCGPS
ncbi:hypothetical protein [Nonomuraea dietziae]|uniref:hypothetical protein n=1 Tax=Nonomuraea dietziae TaxID=65515 RepID=UPI0033C80815